MRSKTLCSNEEAEIIPPNAASSLHPLWEALPRELRQMVLKELSPLAKKRHQMAHWASVSKEWQYFFEPAIFRTLRIRSPGPEIDRMGEIVRDYRIGLVRKIILLIGTTEYNSAEYVQPENSDTIMANNAAAANALTALFSILSEWGKTTPEHHISFKVGAGSKADSHHPYHDFYRYTLRYQPRGDWISNAKKRLLGNLLDPDFQARELPEVPIIRGFTMDPQYYRSFSGESMEKILTSMPRLRNFRYCYWPAVDQNGHATRDAANERILKAVVNNPKIQILVFLKAKSKAFPTEGWQDRSVNHDVVSATVRASYRLRRVAMLGTINAAYFFRDHMHGTDFDSQEDEPNLSRHWPDLTHLALTAPINRLLYNDSEVDSLIISAGTAASRMPKLKMMEVYSPGNVVGFFFRYEIREDNTAKLFIAATWDLEIGVWAIRPWEHAARRRGLQFSCEVEDLEPEVLCSKLRLFPQVKKW
ncbi:hypothetical protein BDP81DRAFT_334935 [Colletotrichum phormii]|uniref:DUF6546 domain-containing protein n=1 Tax=Colletotrichum phormii TaxID=359342 RepID=A0AAI9ZEZ3_9PEZI|nr:uncharacterized protein BDP81DRAFT_334935 [Colletotrichum phormii]KAK1622149.1 hypothetical protein BDP81DRAFT_334935 [Colletotrichum phormii]